METFYEEKQFTSVAGFITGANPLHRGHEYIHRNALEEIDGLFLQPLVEMAKREFVRDEYRIRGYQNVINTYYPQDRSILSPLRVTYIFAGPREAILHALIMKNYGCTHALIGRDHAGIGDFYEKYAGHNVFNDYTEEELGIDIRLFHEVFYDIRAATHASARSVGDDEDIRYRLNISGTGIRELLRYGYIPPKEIVRPESALAAIQGIQPKGIADDGHATITPVGKVVQSMFPFYLEYTRLGGEKLDTPRKVEDLTLQDLETALRDVRANASQIYQDVYDEYSAHLDQSPRLQPVWREEVRDQLRSAQEKLLGELEQKVATAPDTASDKYMYQDRVEAQHEPKAATRLLEELPTKITNQARQQRAWSPMPYQHYRS